MSIFNLDRNMKFDHAVRKKDFLEVLPSTASAEAMNKSGALTFQIQQSSNPLDICNSWMYFKITIKGGDEKLMTLEHNWFLKLFNETSIKLGSSVVETIQAPGETSDLLQYVMTDSDYKKQYGQLSGYLPDTNKGDIDIEGNDKNSGFVKRLELYKEQTFEGMYPLKNIFGFFQLYNRIIYLINFELRMVKTENYSKIFFGSGDKKPTLWFDELKLFVPSITCNPDLESSIIERLNNPKPITVNFLERISYQQEIPTGSRYSFKPALLSTRPRFMIIGFKEITDSYTTNNSKFIQTVGS